MLSGMEDACRTDSAYFVSLRRQHFSRSAGSWQHPITAWRDERTSSAHGSHGGKDVGRWRRRLVWVHA